eukprot:3885710-Karenia_brevis.AAC.1
MVQLNASAYSPQMICEFGKMMKRELPVPLEAFMYEAGGMSESPPIPGVLYTRACVCTLA